MKRTLKQILSLIKAEKSNYVIRYSRGVRNEAEQRIDEMKADLNGCSDQWFLMAKNPLDECVRRDDEY